MHHLIEITQIKKIKLKIIEISIVNICWMVIKKIMTITLNFYIVVNKIYLYNYTDKITV